MHPSIRKLLKPFYSRVIYRLAADLRALASNTILCGASFAVFNQIEGDYLEFGVYLGGSFVTANHAFETFRKQLAAFGQIPYLSREMRYFAFDSFQGLPKPSGKDGSGKTPQHWRDGTVNSGGSGNFVNVLKENGVELSKVCIVEGWYDTALFADAQVKHGLRKAAMVHIDCDFFESTVPVLEFVTGLLQDGTVLVFDDWFRYKNDTKLGEQGACNEWLQKNPRIRLTELARHDSHSIAFIVNLSN